MANFNVGQFITDIASKQGGESLRIVAPVIGVSVATLSRIKQGKTPDLFTYATVCKWLGKSLDEYFATDRDDKLKQILSMIVNETMRGMGSDRSKAQELIETL